MLKLNGDKVVEYVNGELDMEEVKRFDIDLNERNLVIEEKSRPTNAGCRLTEHLIYLHLRADNISKCKHIPYIPLLSVLQDSLDQNQALFQCHFLFFRHLFGHVFFPEVIPWITPATPSAGSTTMSPGRGTSKTTPTFQRCSVASRRSSRVRRCKC